MENTSVNTSIIDEKTIQKKKLEQTCKKIMSIVIPCLCIMMILLTVFKGSKEARQIKSVLKSEDCKVKIYTGTEVSDILDDFEVEFDMEFTNIDELVIAVDKVDPEIYAMVFICESRLDAEDLEKSFEFKLKYDPDADSYTVDRNAKIVCFGYIDLVEVVMDKLD